MTQAALVCLKPPVYLSPWTRSDKVDDNLRKASLSLSLEDRRRQPRLHALLL